MSNDQTATRPDITAPVSDVQHHQEQGPRDGKALAFDPDCKRLANLKAQLTLKGFAVHEVISGGYFCSKWNLTKFCPALQDLEAFARQVGAA